MLNCKEVAKLLSERMDHPLTFWQRMGLGLHLFFCGGCAKYKRQIEAIQRLFGIRMAGAAPGGDEAAGAEYLNLSAAKKQQLTEMVRGAAGE